MQGEICSVKLSMIIPAIQYLLDIRRSLGTTAILHQPITCLQLTIIITLRLGDSAVINWHQTTGAFN